MSSRAAKVVGYFAYRRKTEIVCTGQACIIAGSRQKMKGYLGELYPEGWREYRIKKTTFGEIKAGLGLGAAYGFDQSAYKRFYPLARQAGLPVMAGDFEVEAEKGNRYLIVQLSRVDRVSMVNWLGYCRSRVDWTLDCERN